MKATLILGDEPRVVIPVARSLWRKGVPVIVAALTAESPRPRSRSISRFIRLTERGESATQRLNVLLGLLEQEMIDWLIPTSDSALSFVATHYQQLRALTALDCPGPEAVFAVLDKEETMRAALACHLHVPRSWRFLTLQELEWSRSDLKFPLVGKCFNKAVSAEFKVRYYAHYSQLEQDYRADPDYGSKYLLQEYAKGEGFGVEVLLHSGDPVVLFAHRRIQEHPSTGGVSVFAEATNPIQELVDMSLRLLRHIGWEGVAMVEFRYDLQNRRATLMEINGRYWGSLGLSKAAGVDFPFAAWSIAHGRDVAASTYRVGMRARWTAGVLLRVHELCLNPRSDGMPRPSTLREFFSAVKAFLPGTKDMLWVWDDPFPAIFELLLIGGRLCRQTVKSLIRSILPKTMLARLRTWRSLEHGTRETYVKCQLRRMVSPWRPALPAEVRSALCVCHGNIIRSPFASVQLARVGLRAVSAGLDARPGRGSDERAIRIALEFGVSLAEHSATPLTKPMIENADVVFVMDGVNEARLLARHPQARKKLLLLGCFAPQRLLADEIPDPYDADDNAIRHCYEVISCCVTQVSSSLGLAENSGRIAGT